MVITCSNTSSRRNSVIVTRNLDNHSMPQNRTKKETDLVATIDHSNHKSEPFRSDDNGGNLKSFEEILEDLGCFGPFQVLTLVSYLLMEIAAAFVAFIPILVTRSTSQFVNCTEHNASGAAISDVITLFSEENRTVFYDVTKPTDNSLRKNFMNSSHTPFEFTSIVDELISFYYSEWDLKCDRAWIPDLVTSLLMAGMIIGNLFCSQFADWYGRRKAYLGVLCIMFCASLMSAISPNVYFYGVARFIAGCGYCGFINVSCMSVLEFMTPKWRSLANMAGPIGEGIILLSVLGYYVRPWRQLYLVTLTPYILVIPIYFFLPESPRWLLRNNKIEEAHKVLSYMARINRRQPVSMSVLEALGKQEEVATESQKAKRISYLEFLKTKELIRTSLFLFAMWFSWNVGYYGISYNIRNVPGNRYFNLALIGLANAIGQRASMPISDRFGRRKAVLYGMALAATFLVGLAISFLTMNEVNATIILVACVIGLVGLSCVRASLRLLSGESFPTAVRTMGLGIGSLGANSAGLLTPQTAYLGSRWPALPFFIFATVSIIGSFVVLMMKETSGNPLKDEIQIKSKTSSHESTTYV